MASLGQSCVRMVKNNEVSANSEQKSALNRAKTDLEVQQVHQRVEHRANDTTAAGRTQGEIRRAKGAGGVAMEHQRGVHAAQRSLASGACVGVGERTTIHTDGGSDKIRQAQITINKLWKIQLRRRRSKQHTCALACRQLVHWRRASRSLARSLEAQSQ